MSTALPPPPPGVSTTVAPPLPPPPPGVSHKGGGRGRKHSARRTDELYRNAASKAERVEELRKKLEAECTFRPTFSSSSSSPAKVTAVGGAKGRARMNNLYQSGVAARKAREEKLVHSAALAEREKELRDEARRQSLSAAEAAEQRAHAG